MGCFVDHERVDYISNLPDAILCEILSYLPTKAAVKTSILSTKWKYIWTQVPALDFIDIRHYPIYVMPGYQQNMCMTNTLARVPLLNNASYLERFCFDFDLYRGPINIKSWLDAVKWREIREVSMELYWKELVQLPRQFLCGSKLVALKLDGFRIDDMPPSFHLPSLETVHFGEYIAFPGDQFLQRFLLGCPVLKELFIHSMMGFDETVCIESLTLKSLDIRNVRGTSGDDLCISITTPNLRYLCLRVGQALYNIGDLNMLTEAVLYLWRAYDCRWDIGHNTSQLMKKVSGVRTLWFGITYDLPCQGRLPIFNNLTHLKLQDDRHITDLLRYTPNLKSLVLEHVSSAPAPDFDPEAAHECMSCLERVEFFLNKNSVLDTVEHFLKAATALKEMIINERGLVGTGRLGAVRQKIRSLPMASPICRIKFVD